MNFDYSPEDEAFRKEIRAWMEANVPRDPNGVAWGMRLDRETQVSWERALASKGWLAYDWPVEFGGPGWDVTKRSIFDDERSRCGAPPLSPFGIKMLGPVLMKFGTPAQQQRFLTKIANGDELWAQGYSEPGAGSDLASLKTQAVRKGDHYVVNGQKIWTTQGHWADWIFCLVRTGSDGAKQQGISFLLCDMKSKGIEIRPIMTIDGHHHLNEVFFTDVEVPVENLVGEEGQGWTVAKYLLTHERTGIANVADSHRQIASLKKAVAADPVLKDDANAKRRIAELEVDLLALEYTNLRTLDRVARGQPPGPESSGLKIKGTEMQQAITEAQVELGGNDALVWKTPVPGGDPLFRAASTRYNFLRACTIYGGSNEIQKNVLARLLVGL
ncbi:MAG TPA: acyl-CoA dehydrogenase family protein [Nevskiaceae bacterium]|nr:acyl-CoA dehydrogenase family protein [Nevskiaceae bacterium]